MLRAFFLIFALTGVAMVAILGFRGQHHRAEPTEIFPDMVRQPKLRAQASSNFYADERAMRPPIDGTVPIGYDMPKTGATVSPGAPALPAGTPIPGSSERGSAVAFSVGSDYVNTGKMGDQWGTGIPVPVTPELMLRGEQRFNINCAICHGASAAGNGITKQYGLATVVSLQDERIRKMADGEIFNTITHGKNTMFAYGPNVTVPDRWAIIAYLRALQRSQNATAADVPPDAQALLEKK